jgi:glycosyltransferase involved in cell wall biosynthesis
MLVLLNGLQAGNLSGTGRYTAELSSRLPGLASDVQCTVLWPRHVPEPHLVSGGHDALRQVNARRFWKRIAYDQCGIRFERRRLNADVVHFPANIGPLTPMRGVVLTIHDLSFVRNPAWFRSGRAAYYRWFVGRSAHIAARVITDSHATAADLHELLRVPPQHVDVIPLGVGEDFRPLPNEQRATVRAWYKLPETFFLYVGTIEPRKNLVSLIEAWNRIAAKCPQDLVIAGRDGWKVRPVRTAAALSPYAKRIHFPGFVAHEDLAALLSSADVFVWPSLCEGFGLPPLEAMACGTPVVTSNVSSLPEVVGDAALQVSPSDVDALADAMLRAATDAALRATLSARGTARAATFTWERTARLTLDSYRAALG